MPEPSGPVSTVLSLSQAQAAVAATLAHAATIGAAPLTVAVLDSGGNVVALARQDGSGIARPQIATGKAWIALGMGFGTRELARRAELQPHFVDALPAVVGGQAVPAPGGVLVRASGGVVLGAIGVSGDTSDRDEECAVAGIRSIGLTAVPG